MGCRIERGRRGRQSTKQGGGTSLVVQSLRICLLMWGTLAPWKKSYDQSRQHIKKQRHYFADKGLSSQGYFSSSMYRCESWTIKKAEH